MSSNFKEERVEKLTNYIKENQEKLYKLAYNYVKNEETALDVIQDAIVKALSKVNTLKNEEYIKTWFYRILINECLTYIRKNKNRSTLDIYDFDINYEEKDISETIDIYRQIDTLKPNLKTVVILRFFEDMKLEEIVKVTNTNINTIKTRLYKALDQMKLNIMEDNDYE